MCEHIPDGKFDCGGWKYILLNIDIDDHASSCEAISDDRHRHIGCKQVKPAFDFCPSGARGGEVDNYIAILVKESLDLYILLFVAYSAAHSTSSLRFHSTKAPNDLVNALPRDSKPRGQLSHGRPARVQGCNLLISANRIRSTKDPHPP